ncbi:MAG: DUF2231 domain-containing protein [Actinomycetota bacterium]|nr:DUF2231 domain-containing protein [Actinomycetota bacterium]
MYSKVKIFGHPVHPMLVGFPVALYTATLAGFIIYGVGGDPFWMKMTIALNVAGVGMASVAAVPGLIDWVFGIPSDTAAKRTGLKHLLLNDLALAVFVASMIVYLGDWTNPTRSAGLGIVLAGIGVAATIVAGFLGWKLVQDYHVGISLRPEQEIVDRMDMRRAG